MKRITLFIILFAVMVVIPLMIWQEGFTIISQRENVIATFILTLLELLGITLALFVLYQYIQYRRPRRFVFDGFSNALELATDQKKPIELNNLAREELVFQFQIIYSALKKHADSWIPENSHGADHSLPERKTQCPLPDTDIYTPLFTEEDVCSEGEWHLPTIGSADHMLGKEIYTSLMEQLMQIVNSFGDHHHELDLANVVGGTAPKEIAFILRFIDAILPPPIIKAKGHLQYRSDTFDRVGITFEIIDLSSQQSTVIRTIWQPEQQGKGSTSGSPLAESYVTLLRPAMRWLVLMFWEQKVASEIASFHPQHKDSTRNQVYARLLYLLGTLYQASATQFPEYHRFFNQLAIEHLRKASIEDPEWCLPYNYQANICRIEMQESEGKTRERLLAEALKVHEMAIEHAKDEEKDVQSRFKTCEAITKLASDNPDLINQAKQEIQEVIQEADPTRFDSDAGTSGLYLFDLACWYGRANQKEVGVADAKKLARRYLIYSLMRRPYLWSSVEKDPDLKGVYDEASLRALKEELKKEPDLNKLKGQDFETAANNILRKIEERTRIRAKIAHSAIAELLKPIQLLSRGRRLLADDKPNHCLNVDSCTSTTEVQQRPVQR